MGELAGVFATSHVVFGSPEGDPQAGRVVEGLNEIGRRVRSLRPDVIFMITSDHMFNVTLRLQPPFTVGVADRYTPFGEMNIDRAPFPGARTFAQAFCRRAAASFDLAQAEELRPDHGVMVPLMFVDPERTTPVVPILVNTNMEPPPTAARAAELGRILAQTIREALPAGVRAVVIGAGGLSHWINIPGHQGRVNEAFDRDFLAKLSAGDFAKLEALGTETILRDAGNGGLEVVNWVMAAATLPARGAEVIYYEAMPHWMTGMGGVAFR